MVSSGIKHSLFAFRALTVRFLNNKLRRNGGVRTVSQVSDVDEATGADGIRLLTDDQSLPFSTGDGLRVPGIPKRHDRADACQGRGRERVCSAAEHQRALGVA